MSEPLAHSSAPAPKEDPERLVLRGRPRPAVRFRRGLIVGLTGAVAAAIVALSWAALDPPILRKAAAPFDGEGPPAGTRPDALEGVPRSYGDVPKLGPPLPGDLGRPILEQQRALAANPGAASVGSAGEAEPGAAIAADAERQRVQQARQAARSSPVLVQLGGSPGVAPPAPPLQQPEAPVAPEADAGVAPGQQHKIAFARSSGAPINPDALHAPPSPWTLAAGTIIPASLITGLNSDLPGMVLAQVTENVRDSATGRTVLIPQGARLIGDYDSAVDYGQRRALLVWKRIVFPDGSSIALDSMPASDASGYTGLHDRVNAHGWQLLKGAVLSTLLGVGTQLSLGGEGELIRAVRESAQQNAASAGDQLTRRNLDIQPTIVVRPGWPVRAIVNKDLVLAPWRG